MKPLVRLLLLLAMAAFAHAEKVGDLPAPTGYVDDYADVLSGPGKAQIDALCHEVHAKTRAQIFVVTIHTLEGAPIEGFANDLFHHWKIGEARTDRGVLLLFAIDDHQRRIEVGYGLESILPDGLAGRIGRDMVPALQQANYDQAALTGTQEVAQVIADDAHVTLQPAPLPAAAAPVSDAANPLVWIVPILGFLAVWIGLIRLVRSRVAGRMAAAGLNRNPNANHQADGFVAAPVFYDAALRQMGDSSSSSDPGRFSPGSPDVSSPASTPDFSSSSDTFSGGGGGDSGGGGASGSW